MGRLTDQAIATSARLDQAEAAAATAASQVVYVALKLLCLRARIDYRDTDAIAFAWSEAEPHLVVTGLLCGSEVVDVAAGEWEDRDRLAARLDTHTQEIWQPLLHLVTGRHHPTPHAYVMPMSVMIGDGLRDDETRQGGQR